jgi:hypothetical protein
MISVSLTYEQIKNLAVEYEQTTDGNTEAYFTLLTLAEGAVLLNGVKALVAKVGSLPCASSSCANIAKSMISVSLT